MASNQGRFLRLDMLQALPLIEYRSFFLRELVAFKRGCRPILLLLATLAHLSPMKLLIKPDLLSNLFS